METSYIIGITLIGGLVLYLANSGSLNKEEAPEKNAGRGKIKRTAVGDNKYTEMREMVFGLQPRDLGIQDSAGQDFVYAAVMEWYIGNFTATLVAFPEGDASLYLSSGTIMIGAGRHASVSAVAAEFAHSSALYFELASKFEKAVLPYPGEVCFHLLTNKGIYTGREQQNVIENGHSPWLGLYVKASQVLTQMRLLQERKAA